MGVISGLAGVASTGMTNLANAQIADKNNQFNEKMLEKQMAYNKEMYQQQLGDQWNFFNAEQENQWNMFHATNEYNSPTQQVERLRAAGLNPYLAMNSGNTASSVSGASGSSPSAQGINPPTATPYSASFEGFGQSIAQAAELYAGMQKSKAETEQIKIENNFRAAKLTAELANLWQNTKSDAARSMIEQAMFQFERDLKIANRDESRSRAALNAAQTKIVVTQELLASAELQAFPQRLQMELSGAAADIALKYKQGKLTDKQIDHEVKKTVKTVMETSGVAFQNNQMAMDQAEQADTYNVRYNTIVATMKSAIYNSGIKDPSGLANYFQQLLGGSGSGSTISTDFKYRYK